MRAHVRQPGKRDGLQYNASRTRRVPPRRRGLRTKDNPNPRRAGPARRHAPEPQPAARPRGRRAGGRRAGAWPRRAGPAPVLKTPQNPIPGSRAPAGPSGATNEVPSAVKVTSDAQSPRTAAWAPAPRGAGRQRRGPPPLIPTRPRGPRAAAGPGRRARDVELSNAAWSRSAAKRGRPVLFNRRSGAARPRGRRPRSRGAGTASRQVRQRAGARGKGGRRRAGAPRRFRKGDRQCGTQAAPR